MLRRTDWRALQWTEDDASEPVQFVFSFEMAAARPTHLPVYPPSVDCDPQVNQQGYRDQKIQIVKVKRNNGPPRGT